MMGDLISVVVPVYNVESYIESCVRSLFEQTYDNIEYIFVDDGSEDRSVQILESVMHEYLWRSSHVRILSHGRNLGLSTARKTGIVASGGTWLLNVDSDDCLDPCMIEQLHSLAIESFADVAVCGFTRSMELNGSREPQDLKDVFEIDHLEAMRKAMFGNWMYMSMWNKLFRRSLFDEFDIYAPDGMINSEDGNVTYRAFYYASKVVVCSNMFYHWRCNESSTSHNYKRNTRRLTTPYLDSVERMESFFVDNRIIDPQLIGGMINYERFVMITLALYGDLKVADERRSLFDRVRLRDLVFVDGHPLYSELAGIAFKLRMWPILHLLRKISALRK